MSAPVFSRHAGGVLMCVTGILLLSPEAMIIRLLGNLATPDILFYRNTLMGLSLGAFLLLRHGGKTFAALAAIGAAGWFAVGVRTLLNMGFVASVQNTSVANTLVILATMPAFAAILSWLVIGEKVSLRNMIVAAVSFMGVALIFWQSLGNGTILGDAIALGTAVVYALYIVLVRRENLDFMLWSSCISSLVSGLIMLPFSNPLAVGATDLGLLALLGLALLPAAFGLLFAGARLIPPVECGIITLLEVVFGSLWVWLALNEQPSAMTMLGGAAVLGAIGINALLSIRAEHRRAASEARVEPGWGAMPGQSA